MDMFLGGRSADGHQGWAAGMLTSLASLLFFWSMLQQCIPSMLKEYLDTLTTRIVDAISPYDTITIDEKDPDFFGRSEAYLTTEAYLSATCASRARSLRATLDIDDDRMSLSMDDYEAVVDEFHGANMCWNKSKVVPRATTIITEHPGRTDERRMYRLTFHHRHRVLVEDSYLPHVLAEGREAMARNRQRSLYTNKPKDDWSGDYDAWSSVKFEHPSTFATLAMDPGRKQQILDDLEMFHDGKDFYASVGKAWKRGYLLFGPPGTGKSTMIAAIANFLHYDVYDLELTAVKSNSELRRLFIDTKDKSIIVIEDIDCSIDLTGKRKKKGKTKQKKKDDDNESKVTLSGVLNFIDGLWSGCGGERVIVFTTNHKENLDPALIRRGRMDMHIEMSYCCFESFKVLANNYLGVTDHSLFTEIQKLLGEVNMSPADVAENLMPRSKKKDADAYLGRLVTALKEKAVAGDKGEEEDDSSDQDEEEEGSKKNDNTDKDDDGK
ncbi:AAA-ATPase ASD, mitochondrial-like [Lolium rigidum]|uniref:AAA-ATPase ASD, mitochondrial-like n=1 Tax=Lolium rigidum TaxID=89674 RepID=UPI001F5C8446|nr:AAA-ATPase ASD, mitochondrial-like [Lolium rigidum]